MADPETDLASLSSDYPIALFPVRIETRFTTTAPYALRVRIYPDEIVADLHDPRLTDAEHADGVAYWTEAWDPAAEPDAWARLVAGYQPTRAAWIAQVLEPTNLAQRPTGAPTFPVVARRAPSLAHAKTSVLPTAWVVIAYRGGVEVGRVTSKELDRPLTLGFRPDVAEDDPSLASFGELRVEDELAWAIDFDRAISAGMAVSLPLTQTDVELGFDRVVVVGVMPSDPLDGASQLESLFESHHYTRGLALVRQGTPTNNTGSEAAGYPPSDEAAYSYAIERGAPLAETGSDGARLAHALGVSTSVFDHVDGANRREEEAAQAMARALWPCTLGYFLEQLASPHVTPAQIADIRQHVADHVRGRGPFAAFRIGRVPYGLLPVTSLAQWRAPTNHTADVKLPALVETWRQKVLARTDGVARVGRTADPDGDLLGVLALDASARDVRVREVIGPAYVMNLLALLGWPGAPLETAREAFANSVLAQLGLGGLEPRFSKLTFEPTALRFRGPLAADAPLSETASLADNYIRWLGKASIDELRDAGGAKQPLLFHLLRQAALVEYGRVALDLAIAHGAAVALDRVEAELVHIHPGTETRDTPWTRFAAPLGGVTGGEKLGRWLLLPSSDVERQPIRAYREALEILEPLPTAELDRLTAETLDTCAYRVDAWVTSLATRELLRIRQSAPTGVYIGAYAWVEDLRVRTAPRPGASGGFIHAPSPTHAAAAAILRSAYLTRTGVEREQVAVNLSSRRVRTALELVDGVRQGQPLGALLGYRFERAVHDAALDRYIAPLRARFPLGADPGSPPSEASERIPARAVVDGLALREALDGATDEAAIPWANLPAVDVGDRPALAACLLQLDEDVDASADVMLAETIFQAVQGNHDRASATLDSLAGGGTPPMPQVTEVPARALSFTQRVGVLLGAPEGVEKGWKADAPRARANPRLEAWIAERLGAPARVQCRISYPDPVDPETTHVATASLADLALCAHDVLELARRTPPEGGGELDARIAWHAAHGLGISTQITIAHGRGDASPLDEITFLELFEVARLLGDVIAGARALTPADLEPDGHGGATFDEAELLARAVVAQTELAAARSALASAVTGASDQDPGSVDALRSALWSLAAFGVRGAVPASVLGSDQAIIDALLAQAAAALAEVDRRLEAITKAPGDGMAQLAIALGPELRILPTFVATNRADVDAAIAGGPAIVDDAYATRRWFEGAARIREPLGRVRLATLAAEALGGGAIELAATQLPLGARWIGLPFDLEEPTQAPRGGTLSLVLQTNFDRTVNEWAGLVFDEWTEAIPHATQMTSLAVSFDAPGAEAPQCVLLAVHPGGGLRTRAPNWSLSMLVDIVGETADLAKIRAVDPDLLGEFGLAAPTTYIAANVADDTISIDLSAHRVTDVVISG